MKPASTRPSTESTAKFLVLTGFLLLPFTIKLSQQNCRVFFTNTQVALGQEIEVGIENRKQITCYALEL
jgi:hypothetical protein